jgi:hypothetical protein
VKIFREKFPYSLPRLRATVEGVAAPPELRSAS